MNLNIIITGASGMVGKGVLLECLDHQDVARVLSIGRTSLHIDHPKFNELIISDFLDYTGVTEQLTGYDACFLCMGVSASGMTEQQYHVLTYDYTLALASTLKELNKNMTCIYVSGEGTDTSEQGRVMWARVKGKTENHLLQLGFTQAYMFRPGIILPLRGITSKTRLYQFFYDYFMWLAKLIKWLAPNSVVNTTQVGLAMIHVTRQGFSKAIIKPRDIITLAGQAR